MYLNSCFSSNNERMTLYIYHSDLVIQKMVITEKYTGDLDALKVALYFLDKHSLCEENNELKQMFAYNLYGKSAKSLLLYPKLDQADSSFGTYHYVSDETTNQCKLGFVSAVRENALIPEKELAEEVLKKLELPVK